MSLHESRIVSFFIYNPELSKKEGTEHLKILYYYPEDEVQNRKVRNIGLCEALVNFTKTFRPNHPCETVHTQKSRQVYFEPEPSIWMVLTVSVPWVERAENNEKKIEYLEDNIQDTVLKAGIALAYSMFKFFNGTFHSINHQFGLEELKRRMEKFFKRYVMHMNVRQMDIFDVFQGIQFLPLDKYMYLKVHCFVNLIETTFRTIKRTVMLYNDNLIWSGLEQDDIKVFYQYLLSWLFPMHYPQDFHSGLSLVTQSVGQSLGVLRSSASTPNLTTETATHTGGFLIGLPSSSPGGSSSSSGSSMSASMARLASTSSSSGVSEKTSPSPWVYVTIDGQHISCKLYVYSAGNATMCFFVGVEGGGSPMSGDFCKRLGTFLGPRLAQISAEITEFREKSKDPKPPSDPGYQFVYFNEMNLAVKSPSLTRKAISADVLRLLTEVNVEYDKIEEGETIIRTAANNWVACRKSGHRRFFVVFTQNKAANFAEINDEVRKLCQKEFTNIFFLD